MQQSCAGGRRNYEQPNEHERRDASDRTRALRRRTLYETTAKQIKTKTKKPLNGVEYANTANGDIRLDGDCLRFSYSHAAHIDAAVGKVLTQANCATPAALRDAQSKRSAPPRASYDTKQSVTSYTNVIMTDVSYNAGKYNQMTYDPNDRLESSDTTFPGVIVDPSGVVLTRPLNYVDMCANAFGVDFCLNTVVATAVPPVLQRSAAVMDACFGFPFRTKFVL